MTSVTNPWLDDAKDPADAVAKLLRVLELTPGAQPDTFAGINFHPPRDRLFGGQVLGQALTAATRTVADDRPPHSLHGYFLRPGDATVPVTFEVERLHDGRSFSTRRTHALQHGKAILSMIASFQIPATGMDHQVDPPPVPGPDDLPAPAEMYDGVQIPALQERVKNVPVEIRYVDGPLFLPGDRPRVAHQSVWIRAAAPLPDDPVVHRAFLAYMSDMTMMEATLRRHGHSWSTAGLRSASLDHAMWIHRPFRADDWLLYAADSTSASGSRGLHHGRFYTRDGVLVASTAQEAMLRVPD
jgi:acyl-CoA thioesterase-2